MSAADKSIFQVDELSTSFTWELPDLKSPQNISSETFCCPDYEEIKWCLQYIHSTTTNKSLILLRLVSSDTLNFVFRFNCCTKVGNKETFTRDGADVVTKPNDEFVIGYLYSPTKCIYTIKVGVKLLVKELKRQSNSKGSPKRPQTGLTGDLRRLLEDNKGDLSLSVAGKKLKVHKLIVIARSKVLAAMLDEDKAFDELDIPGVDFDVMKSVVHYMYTDEVEDIEKHSCELYQVACSYALWDLKTLCEDTLEDSLTVENATETLVLVHQHSKDLKTRVINFMKADFKQISVTDSFQSALLNNRDLCLEVFCTVLDVTQKAHVAG